MSDCPSSSVVKLDSRRVAELARNHLVWARLEREKALAAFDEQIAAVIQKRQSGWRKWLGFSTDRQAVYDSFPFVWKLQYERWEMRSDAEDVARSLVIAAAEADEVWVSVSDLEAIS